MENEEASVKRYAHRGYINQENSVSAIQRLVRSHPTLAVEIDVRFNTERRVVLCHDREMRNEPMDLLQTLCQLETPSTFMIDIKAFGVESAKELARAVVKVITMYRHHTYELCSFNEYCVQELIELRHCSSQFVSPYTYRVGIISTGVPVGVFGHLWTLDFLSFHYDVMHEELLQLIRQRYPHVHIYTWVCNDPQIQHLMQRVYHVDGIIYDMLESENEN